jgi:hypothetical protein
MAGEGYPHQNRWGHHYSVDLDTEALNEHFDNIDASCASSGIMDTVLFAILSVEIQVSGNCRWILHSQQRMKDVVGGCKWFPARLLPRYGTSNPFLSFPPPIFAFGADLDCRRHSMLVSPNRRGRLSERGILSGPWHACLQGLQYSPHLMNLLLIPVSSYPLSVETF